MDGGRGVRGFEGGGDDAAVGYVFAGGEEDGGNGVGDFGAVVGDAGGRGLGRGLATGGNR